MLLLFWWMKICSNWHLAESPRGGISVTEKGVLKKKLTIVEYRGGRNRSIMHLHMIDLTTRRRDIASCPWTKLSHLGKCSHGKLCTSILVNDRTLRSTADFASALSNVNNVKLCSVWISCNVVVFLRLFSPKNHLQKVARFWKHQWGDSFMIT